MERENTAKSAAVGPKQPSELARMREQINSQDNIIAELQSRLSPVSHNAPLKEQGAPEGLHVAELNERIATNNDRLISILESLAI